MFEPNKNNNNALFTITDMNEANNKDDGDDDEDKDDIEKTKETKTFSSLKYINIISTCFGVMPIHFEPNSQGKATYSIFGLIVTSCYEFLYIYFCLSPIVFTINDNNVRDLATDWIWKLDNFHYTLLMSNIITLIIFIVHTKKITKFSKVIIKISKIDSALIKNHVITNNNLKKIKYKELKYFILIIILCIMLTLGSSNFMINKYYEDNNLKHTVMLQDFLHICSFCIELQFHALVTIIIYRFQIINNALASLLHYQPPMNVIKPNQYLQKPYLHYEKYTIPIRLHKLILIHDILMSTCIDCNKMFQLQMFLDITVTCTLMIIDLYVVLFLLLYTQSSWFDMFNIWVVHYIVKLTLITYSGHLIKRNIKNTREILAASKTNLDPHIEYFVQNELEAYLTIMETRFKYITLFDIVKVDLNFLMHIICAICTYVLIMLEYKWHMF